MKRTRRVHARRVQRRTTTRTSSRWVRTVAIGDGKADVNPVKAVKLFKENNQRVRFLTDDEETALRDAIGEEEWPMAAVAIHTGLRQAEQFKLRWEHVDFATGLLTVPRSKHRETRSNERYGVRHPPHAPEPPEELLRVSQRHGRDAPRCAQLHEPHLQQGPQGRTDRGLHLALPQAHLRQPAGDDGR